MTVGKGLNSYIAEVYLSRNVNGTAFAGTDAVTVNLSSSDPTKLTVPATVTIPAGSSTVNFPVTGVDLTNSTPVTIDATATGYTAPATKLAGTVVAPVFNFSGLAGSRSPTSVRDPLSVSFTVPGAIYSGNQTAATNLPVDLTIVNDNPAGIVDGFYSAATAGTAVTRAVVSQGSTNSNTVYVDTPTVAGSYQVQASVPGTATGLSAVQTVFAPTLKLYNPHNVTAVTVGKGLNTYLYEVYLSRNVNGTAFAGTDAVTVSLACSSSAICSVPASVTIPSGSSSVNFKITGLEFGNTTVTASAVGYNSPAQDLAVTVVSPQLNFSGPGNTTVGNKTNFSIYLTTPGAIYSSNQTASSTITANTTSSAPGVATVPEILTIALDSTWSNTGQLTGVAAGTTTLTASGSGLQTATSSVITINP
ncbi:MAG: hypothetical protein PHF31_11185 [Methylobacter sp.]|nr:hypothetical protein [Methylobacter sp.]